MSNRAYLIVVFLSCAFVVAGVVDLVPDLVRLLRGMR